MTSIQLNLEIKGRLHDISYGKLEELRVQIRRHMLSFIFDCSDAVVIDHHNLSVDGDIKITESL